MRFFPGAARHALAVLLVGVLSVATLTLPLAHADDEGDLKDRRREVRGQVARAAGDLKESSREAVRAGRALDRAEGKLSNAQSRLGAVRGR